MSTVLTSKTRDRLTNLIIVALALFLAFTLAREYFNANKPANRPVVGSTLSVQGVDWDDTEQTLLVVLDASCPYTAQSLPLYRQLVEHAAGRHHVRLIGVVNTSLEEGKKYVEENDLRIDVIRWYFRKLNVSETPTLILVNKSGEIMREWTGILSPEGEADVVSQLFDGVGATGAEAAGPGPAPRPSSDHRRSAYGISLPELRGLMKEERVTILDLDNREVYAAEHIAPAKNIPADELYIRALNELDKDALIVLYTRKYNRLFLGHVQTLKGQGFDKVKVLHDGLDGWKREGLPVATGRSAK